MSPERFMLSDNKRTLSQTLRDVISPIKVESEFAEECPSPFN